MFTLAAEELEGDTDFPAVTGLKSVIGAETTAEGRDLGVGKGATIACFVVMVVFAQAYDTKVCRGGAKVVAGLCDTPGDVLNVRPDRTFLGQEVGRACKCVGN